MYGDGGGGASLPPKAGGSFPQAVSLYVLTHQSPSVDLGSIGGGCTGRFARLIGPDPPGGGGLRATVLEPAVFIQVLNPFSPPSV